MAEKDKTMVLESELIERLVEEYKSLSTADFIKEYNRILDADLTVDIVIWGK